jgi:hypothetical protein
MYVLNQRKIQLVGNKYILHKAHFTESVDYVPYQTSGYISCLWRVIDRIHNPHPIKCVVIQFASCPFHLADIQFCPWPHNFRLLRIGSLQIWRPERVLEPIDILFFMAQHLLVILGLLFIEVLRSHSDTLSKTPLDKCSARFMDLHLTTHNTHKRKTSKHPAGFEPAIPASEQPQTHAATWYA